MSLSNSLGCGLRDYRERSRCGFLLAALPSAERALVNTYLSRGGEKVQSAPQAFGPQRVRERLWFGPGFAAEVRNDRRIEMRQRLTLTALPPREAFPIRNQELRCIDPAKLELTPSA